MYNAGTQSFILKSKNRNRGNGGPMRADHNNDWQSPTQNRSSTERRSQSPESQKSKRRRLDKSNEILTPSPVIRHVVSLTTTSLPSIDSQATKNISSTRALHPNPQLKNVHHSKFKSIHAPLASSEDISIDRSMQDLVGRSVHTPISRTFSEDNSDRLAKSYRSRSREKIKTEDTSAKRSLSQSTSQLHRLKNEQNAKTRLGPHYRSSLSTLRGERTEAIKATIREIPRPPNKQTKAVDIPPRNDTVHTTSQKQILAESVPECLDLTISPIHSREETIASSVESKQDDAEDILQSSKSSSQEISLERTNTFRNSLRRPTDVQRGRCGLRNIGNTCFMNSALQCLSNVPDLTEYILEFGVTNILNTTNDLGTHGNVALAYAQLVGEMWSGKQTIAEGSAVKRYVSELSPRFAGYNQQDSHEFLNVLLDALHEDLKRDAEEIENETSLISDIFHGQIRSRVTCDCGEPVITFDSISFLALPIPDLPPVPPRRQHSIKSPQRAVTLIDCFRELFKVEILGENGQWFCNKCNCLMDAEKKLDLWSPPQVLILQLKRFTYDLSNNVKIQTLVEFPIDSPLDLGQFISDPHYKENTLYDLVAISNHAGSLAGGHYTTYAKNFLTKNWLHFNDQIVRVVDEETLLSPNAYILVYRRQKK